MSREFRSMVYAAVARFHVYRKDIVPLKTGERTDAFYISNYPIIERVEEEIKNLFNYKLSKDGIRSAVEIYTDEPLSITNTEALKA